MWTFIFFMRFLVIQYMGEYDMHHVGSNAMITSIVGGGLNFIEFLITGGHFFNLNGISDGFYITHATGLAFLLGDIFNIGGFQFSIGDVVLIIAILISFL